jgi:hypothetical protein
VWAGVPPISVSFGEPVPDPQLRPELPVPAHVRDRVGQTDSQSASLLATT